MREERFRIAMLLVAAAAVACSSGDEPSAEDSAAISPMVADSGMPAPMSAEPGTGNAAPVSVEDIDRWQRGMAAELDAVKAAGEKLKAARSGTDSVSAMMGTNEMSTLDAGASAAGLPPERYKFVRSTLSAAALAISPLELDMAANMPPSFADDMKKQGEANLARMSADIPAEVVAALRPRATDLRKQHITLVTERLRASGAAQ